MANWLKDAVFYEIYPQSFYDSNGDGIGDFNGITEKLDYIKSLGCNAIWMNPCYDSPFKDAGYDVRDYKKVADRYGTEADLVHLFEEVHKRDMHIILDLVPGHTSEEHAWFKESCKAEKNEFSDRYIWTGFWLEGGDGLNFVAGEAPRDGAYITNFFKCQPALNYGFLKPEKPWQKSMDDPACLATREAVFDIICFWLEKGCDGFRVDMADSLIKRDDEHKSGTIKVWQDILGRVHTKYPEAAFVSEWGRPNESLDAGFDMDFLLDWWGSGYKQLVREYSDHEGGEDNSYFRKMARNGSAEKFLNDYMSLYEQSKGKGYIALITGNHDTPRIQPVLNDEEAKLFYAFFFTLPGTPFMYYGDEIGMRYIDGMPTKEGGFTRTGTRTPMQWNSSVNAGFSVASEDKLYLPIDKENYKSVNVEAEEKDSDSLLNVFRKITAFRHENPELTDNDNLELLSREPLAYKRGSLVMVVNPTNKEKTYSVCGDIVFSIGDVSADATDVILKSGSFVAVRLSR